MSGTIYNSFTFFQIAVDDEKFVTFKSTGCDAFTAMSHNAPDTMIVGLKGGNYVSEHNGKVELSVPPDCFDDNTSLGIQVRCFITSTDL